MNSRFARSPLDALFSALFSAGDKRASVLETIKRTVRDRRREPRLLSFVLEHVDDGGALARQLAQDAAIQRQALATIRGLALEQMLSPRGANDLDELVDQLVRWMRAK